MTVNELKRAFLDERPVAFGGITYQKITAVIYDPGRERTSRARRTAGPEQAAIAAVRPNRVAKRSGPRKNQYRNYGGNRSAPGTCHTTTQIEKDLIAKECIEAFKAGFRFGESGTP